MSQKDLKNVLSFKPSRSRSQIELSCSEAPTQLLKQRQFQRKLVTLMVSVALFATPTNVEENTKRKNK